MKVGDRVTFNQIHYCGTCYHCQNGMQNLCSAPECTNGGMSDYPSLSEVIGETALAAVGFHLHSEGQA